MPEISSIPYESAEDLNKYLFDNYYSTEKLESMVSVTGFLRNRIFELSQETGVTQNSVCMINYNYNYFNPLYAEAIWKCYLNSMANCYAFFGFKETLEEPTFPSVGPMVESHAGFIVDDGKLYASVADGTEQQYVEIVGIDATRVQNYKIEYNKFYIHPLPESESSLGLPAMPTTFPGIIRKWNLMTTLSNYPPQNQVHYLVQYIKNSVGADKRLVFNRFIYKEVYAD